MAAELQSPLPAPVLVLGVGNRLLQDDGVGLELLRRVESQFAHRLGTAVDFVDGGTQGLALLGLLDDRHAVLVLDAVARGARPGTVHAFDALGVDSSPRASTAHESSITELLNVARLLGRIPPQVEVVGIEPAIVRTGIGLSPAVAHTLLDAATVACSRLDAMCSKVREVLHA